MLMLRIRACHVYGRFLTKNNRKPAFFRSRCAGGSFA